LFVGEELGVIFVRRAVGPNASPGLEMIRIAETADAGGRVLVRTHSPFAPLPAGETSLDHVSFTDPVVLVRAPLRVTFAYKREDTDWMSNWRALTWPGAVPAPNSAEQRPISLPAAIRFTVRDTVAERVLAVSTATRVHADLAAPAPQNQDQNVNPTAAQPAAGDGMGGGAGPRRGGGG
jgi:general secretion pathway protein J